MAMHIPTTPGLHEYAREELVSGLPVDDVVERIHGALRSNDTGNRFLAFFLNDMEERELFHQLGYSCTAHYARTNFNISKSKIYELLQAGRCLRKFTEIDHRFWKGELSWSQVRLIVRIAESATEKAWIKKAIECNLKDLALAVKHARPGEAPKDKSCGLPESLPPIQLSFDASSLEVWETAKRGLQEELGEGVNDLQLATLLAEAYVQGKLSDKKSQSVYAVVVTKCSTCKEATVLTDDGRAPVDEKALERVLCDAEVIDLTEETQVEDSEREIDRATPEWMRDRVLARDSNRCKCCGRTRSLNAHHIHFRGKGGRTTLSNLISLCATCHSHVHEGFLTVKGDAGSPMFFNLRGQRIQPDYETTSTQIGSTCSTRETIT